ncbi:hypothetical protein CYG49_03360 [Candidatus Saccharibacteria bacterium]|nr:MAG: hypothetical protein CYG49_03360 [Candidatus Saccharibacteria bacterium]
MLDARQTSQTIQHPSGEIPPGDAVRLGVARDHLIDGLAVGDVDAETSHRSIADFTKRQVVRLMISVAGSCTGIFKPLLGWMLPAD